MMYYLTPEQWDGIPTDYKTEKSVKGGRACFISFLTCAPDAPGTTLCFENEHFIVGAHRNFSEVQRNNGEHAVQCLDSETARDFYNTGAVEVWEYSTQRLNRDGHFSLYAYQYGNEYGEDLTGAELEQKLIALFQHSSMTSDMRSIGGEDA